MFNIILKTLKILNPLEKTRLFFLVISLVFLVFFELICISSLYELTKILINESYIYEIEQKNILNYLNLVEDGKLNFIYFLYFIIGIYIFKFFYSIFHFYSQSKFIESVRMSVLTKLTDTYLSKKYVFFLNINSSKLVRNLHTETGNFSLGVMNSVVILFSEFLLILGIFAFLSLESFEFVVFSFFTVLLISVFYFMITSPQTKKFSIQKFEYTNFFLKSIIELFQGIKNIRIYAAEKFFKESIKKNLFKISQAQIFFNVTTQIPRLMIELTVIIIVISLLIVIGLDEFDEKSLSKLALFVIASFKLLPSFSKISSNLHLFRMNKPSVELIYNEYKNSKKIPDKTANQLHFKKEIIFKNVSYKYSEREKKIFDKINLKLKKGTFIGIVGKSGVGKSTFLDLLIGFLSPTSGKILIDGKELKSWRQIINQISYVPQNIHIFNDSLKNNIVFNPKDIVQTEKVLDACKKAGLSSLIKNLPSGVNSKIKESGKNLSGGQSQRIGIARSLYKNSSILLLDEATGSLDTSTEAKIMKSIKKFSKDSIKIIVTHRKSNLKYCDKVYEIKNSKFVNFKNSSLK